jgi:hypothetical protein
MQTRYLAYPIFIILLVLVIFVKWSTDKQGLPAIESSIDQQLSNMVLTSTNLNGLEVGRKGQVRMIGNSSPFEGDIQYQAKLNGSAVVLVVYWAGDSNKCQLTKIESHSSDFGLQTLWKGQ